MQQIRIFQILTYCSYFTKLCFIIQIRINYLYYKDTEPLYHFLLSTGRGEYIVFVWSRNGANWTKAFVNGLLAPEFNSTLSYCKHWFVILRELLLGCQHTLDKGNFFATVLKLV